MNSTENPNALKHMYNKEFLKRVAKAIRSAYPQFNEKQFLSTWSEFSALEMKPRVRRVRDELHLLLPASYEDALDILLQSLKTGALKGFDLWPYTEYVQTYGLKNHDKSLRALKVMTKLFTSEWAVRPFIKSDAKNTMKFLEACALDKDVHVRRWASEGTRPRLPWGERLHEFILKPSWTSKILDTLKFDEELYVRKSIANHLNDIAKDHPDYVVETLKKWKKQAGSKHVEKVDWVIRRALRTLIKNGDKGALELIGVSTKAKARVSSVRLKTKSVSLGEYVSFEFELASASKEKQKFVVDYVIHFVKANGEHSPKVFKLKTIALAAGQKVVISKNHPVKPITTRKYYTGQHLLEIQVNGNPMGRVAWHLKTGDKIARSR